MKKYGILSFAAALTVFAFLLSTGASAQSALPVLRAHSSKLDIRDGKDFHKGIWVISPHLKPDVYIPKFTGRKKRVTFVSGPDSLSFMLKPGSSSDFWVLLDGDSALTRITYTRKAAPVPAEAVLKRDCRNCPAGPDTIPFTIGRDNGIHVKARLNGSDTLDFLFDTGASACVLASSVVPRVNIRMDDSVQNTGADGVHTTPIGRGNRLQVGRLVWDNLSVLSIPYQNVPFDGVMGGNTFAGQRVEIDYERKRLIVYSEAMEIPAGYTRFPIRYFGDTPYIEAGVSTGDKIAKGWMLFDTGSDWSLYLSPAFVGKHGLAGVLPKIGTSVSKGSAGGRIESDLVVMPGLVIGKYELYRIPVTLGTGDGKSEVGHNDILGNLLLKRFNVILDYKNHFIYLKPNNLLHTPYLDRLLK